MSKSKSKHLRKTFFESDKTAFPNVHFEDINSARHKNHLDKPQLLSLQNLYQRENKFVAKTKYALTQKCKGLKQSLHNLISVPDKTSPIPRTKISKLKLALCALLLPIPGISEKWFLPAAGTEAVQIAANLGEAIFREEPSALSKYQSANYDLPEETKIGPEEKGRNLPVISSMATEILDLAPTIEVGKYSIGDANGVSYRLNSNSPYRIIITNSLDVSESVQINIPSSYEGKEIYFGTTNKVLDGINLKREGNNLILTNVGKEVIPLGVMSSFFVDLR